LALLVWLAALVAEHASAQPPGSVPHFRFIPSRSTLDVTGGFAGIHQQFFAYGRFGLNTELEGEPHAEFVNVDSWLVPDSPLTFVWHTDSTLNLSGLAGSITSGDASRIVFHGVDGQGAPFQLTAVRHGQLLRLTGENEPPCCDVFKYRLDALAHVAPYADFNLDGIVDYRDADVLASNIGTFSHATFEQGDADGDGDVDGGDFLAWQRAIGPATPMSAFAAAPSTGAALATAIVPEPARVVSLIAAGGGFLLRRPRRRHN
jgi:hypothetical protein